MAYNNSNDLFIKSLQENSIEKAKTLLKQSETDSNPITVNDIDEAIKNAASSWNRDVIIFLINLNPPLYPSVNVIEQLATQASERNDWRIAATLCATTRENKPSTDTVKVIFKKLILYGYQQEAISLYRSDNRLDNQAISKILKDLAQELARQLYVHSSAWNALGWLANVEGANQPNVEAIDATALVFANKGLLITAARLCAKTGENKPSAEVVKVIFQKLVLNGYKQELMDLYQSDNRLDNEAISKIIQDVVQKTAKVSSVSQRCWEALEWLANLEGANQPNVEAINATALAFANKGELIRAAQLCAKTGGNKLSADTVKFILQQLVLKGYTQQVNSLCQSDNRPDSQSLSEILVKIGKAFDNAKNSFLVGSNEWEAMGIIAKLDGEKKPNAEAITLAAMIFAKATKWELATQLCEKTGENKPSAEAVTTVLVSLITFEQGMHIERLLTSANRPSQETLNTMQKKLNPTQRTYFEGLETGIKAKEQEKKTREAQQPATEKPKTEQNVTEEQGKTEVEQKVVDEQHPSAAQQTPTDQHVTKEQELDINQKAAEVSQVELTSNDIAGVDTLDSGEAPLEALRQYNNQQTPEKPNDQPGNIPKEVEHLNQQNDPLQKPTEIKPSTNERTFYTDAEKQQPTYKKQNAQQNNKKKKVSNFLAQEKEQIPSNNQASNKQPLFKQQVVTTSPKSNTTTHLNQKNDPPQKPSDIKPNTFYADIKKITETLINNIEHTKGGRRLKLKDNDPKIKLLRYLLEWAADKNDKHAQATDLDKKYTLALLHEICSVHRSTTFTLFKPHSLVELPKLLHENHLPSYDEDLLTRQDIEKIKKIDHIDKLFSMKMLDMGGSLDKKK